MRAAAAGTGLVMIVVRTMMMVVMVMKMIMNNWYIKILPKALRTTLTGCFGLVGLVSKVGLVESGFSFDSFCQL